MVSRAHMIVAVIPAPRLIAATIGVARSVVVAIGVRVVLGALAGVGDYLLRRRRGSKRRRNERGTNQRELHTCLLKLV